MKPSEISNRARVLQTSFLKPWEKKQRGAVWIWPGHPTPPDRCSTSQHVFQKNKNVPSEAQTRTDKPLWIADCATTSLLFQVIVHRQWEVKDDQTKTRFKSCCWMSGRFFFHSCVFVPILFQTPHTSVGIYGWSSVYIETIADYFHTFSYTNQMLSGLITLKKTQHCLTPPCESCRDQICLKDGRHWLSVIV